MKNFTKIFGLLLLMNFSNIAQTVTETEPNNSPSDEGVITINAPGNYIGAVSYDDEPGGTIDKDYWLLPFGSSSIDLNFPDTDGIVDIYLQWFANPDYTSQQGYQVWAGGENPSSIVLNPSSYYVIQIKIFNSLAIRNYTINVEDGILPVELTSFNAQINNNVVILNWQTATEFNNYGFEIERTSTQNILWEKVGFVQGHGNCNSPKNYSFSDKPIGGSTFKYRLKQIDTDGKYEYSPEVEVNLNVPTDFSVKQNFPNPFNPTTKIEFSIPSDNNVELKVYNVLGMEVATLLNEHRQAETHSIEFNASNLSSGIYFYKVVSGNYSEIKKMLLLR